ncbi:MAG: ABC transporter substrate-binding protein, partial [bacterium]
MINKKLNWFFLISFIAVLFISSLVLAQEDQIVDPEIPESWYERLPLASEAGITEFNQSPMLDKKVEQGELPPVEDRLPKDPAVIEPYKEIGNY